MSVSVCLFVTKDLADRWTDRVLHNRVASHRSREGFMTIKNVLGGKKYLRRASCAILPTPLKIPPPQKKKILGPASLWEL